LSVDPLGDEVVGASLPFLYWEGYDPKAYSDSDDYEAARRAYDDAFDVAAHSARRVLASPAIEWRDSDEEAHRASVWEGRDGVLILQQACFDPQFGIELDFWLLGGSLKQFSPTSPLIDWLVSWSKAAHDARGFPPLAQ